MKYPIKGQQWPSETTPANKKLSARIWLLHFIVVG